MPKQQISANQISVGTAGSGSVLTSNGTNAYWSNTLTVTANALVLSAGSNTSPALKFTSGNTLFVANAGVIEYTGTAFYATPIGTQRGVVPGQQMFVLNTPFVGNNATGAQGVFGTGTGGSGLGVTLASNTTYAFEGWYPFSKASGTTSHSMSLLFGGSATISLMNYIILTTGSSSSSFSSGLSASFYYSQSNSAILIAGPGLSVDPVIVEAYVKGTVSVNAGGTLIPQYSLSAAPGGAYTTANGAFFSIYPISTGSANVSIGTWA